jgi:hypothetical protein
MGPPIRAKLLPRHKGTDGYMKLMALGWDYDGVREKKLII